MSCAVCIEGRLGYCDCDGPQCPWCERAESECECCYCGECGEMVPEGVDCYCSFEDSIREYLEET